MTTTAKANNKRTKLTVLLELDEWAVGLVEGAPLVAVDPDVVDKIPPWGASFGTTVIAFPAAVWKASTVSLA